MQYKISKFTDLVGHTTNRGPFLQLVSYTATCEHFVYNVCEVPEPKTTDEALSDPRVKEWKESADSRYQLENDTWDLVELPEGREAIGRGVFKVKHDSCGKVEKFKGRLVAKLYSQKYGIDFEETFAPVVCFSSIRTLLAFPISNDMIVHQMDTFSMESYMKIYYLGMKFLERRI